MTAACEERSAIPRALCAVAELGSGAVTADDVRPLARKVSGRFGPTDHQRTTVALHHAVVRLYLVAGDPKRAAAHAERRRRSLATHLPDDLPAPSATSVEQEAEPALRGLHAVRESSLRRKHGQRVDLALAVALGRHRDDPVDRARERLAWALAVAELGATVDRKARLSDRHIERFIAAAWTIHVGAARRGPDVDLIELASASCPYVLGVLADRHGLHAFRDLAGPFWTSRDDGVRYAEYHNAKAAISAAEVSEQNKDVGRC